MEKCVKYMQTNINKIHYIYDKLHNKIWLARNNIFLVYPFNVAFFTDFSSLYYQEEYISSSVNVSNLKITLTNTSLPKMHIQDNASTANRIIKIQGDLAIG